MFEVDDSDGSGNEENILPVHFTKGLGNEKIELRFNEDLNELEYESFHATILDAASTDVPEEEVQKVEQQDKLPQSKVDMSYVLNQIRTKHQDTIQFDSKYKLDKSIRWNSTRAQVLSDIIKHCASDDQFLPCIATNVIDDITTLTAAKTKMQHNINALSGRLRNYTCNDESIQTSTPIYTYNTTLQYRGVDREYEVNVLLDKTRSKIWTVNNFVSKEECDLFIEHGTPKLERAAVTAEDGFSVVSESRKANQANYEFLGSPSNDPLGELYQRVLNMTNTHTGFRLERAGQNGFNIIQYDINDQYM